MNSTDNIIELTGLTTGYRNKIVTRHIDATLRSGELTCLLGPNGAGKSTLLKTLSGFIPPLEGNITVNGTDLRRMSANHMARTASVVLTERPAAMNMTVRELVSLGRTPYTSFLGSLKAPDEAIVDEALSLVDINNLSRRNVATLSDGERQKALIAKALAQQTGIILLDEPTAFLDYPAKAAIMKLLYRIAHEGRKAIFISTHDIEMALRIADRIWLLDKPHGLTIGSPRSLIDNGFIAQYFLSDVLSFNPDSVTFDFS